MATQEQLLDVLGTVHLHTDLKGRSVRGGLLTLGSQGTTFLIQTVSTVILARLLTPADFGLVAMITAITGLAQAFADLGLSEATIQCEEISQGQISNLFWINVSIGLALTLITAALAPVFVWFYREPMLRDITLLMSLTFLIGALRVQHDALLRRQMRFSSLAIRDVVSYVVAVPVAIALALSGAGYWALVAMPLTLNSTQVVISWLMVRWMPSLPQRGSSVGSLIAFGGNVAASYVAITMNRSIDNVLVGWYWGAGPLGLYSRAYNLLMLPVRQLSAPAASVAIPAFSRIQGDPERFARYFLRSINLIMWISAPTFGFLFVAATPVIVLLLGNQWRGAAPVFQILAVSAFGQLLLESTIWLFVSRGQSKQLFKVLLKVSPIVICSFAIGLPFGIKGVAFLGSLALMMVLPFMLRLAFRGTDLTLLRLGKALLCPVSLALVGILSGEIALRLIGHESAIKQILAAALGFGIAYLLSGLIPHVRNEAAALRGLFSDLRFTGQDG